MFARQEPNVAILLATYNGARHVERQIKSLADNKTSFTLHWLDDHSIDDTRKIVRITSENVGIPLREWHQAAHQGIPAAFFHLLESVEADIYLFCDQDDIWQPGKIDATVDYLASALDTPLLCYSDSILFYESGLLPPRRFSRTLGTRNLAKALRRPPTFLMFSPLHAAGHTQGFTRKLREIYLSHRDIARKYAFLHDIWMHDIAAVSGETHVLAEAPTALWRQHAESFCAGMRRRVIPGFAGKWREVQLSRQRASRHLQGIVLASSTFASGRNLTRLLRLGRLGASLDKRQSPFALIKLVFLGGRHPRWSRMLFLVSACLFSSAVRHEPDAALPSGASESGEQDFGENTR